MKPPLVFHGSDGYRRELVPGWTLDYCLGLDLGQVNDPTALCVVEKRTKRDEPTIYGIRALERWLGVPYPEQVRRVMDRLALPPLDRARALIIDRTGVGRAVFDAFREARPACAVIGATITGGDAAHKDDRGGWSLPKRDLVGVAQMLLMQRRIEIAPALAEAETLASELRDFRVKISPAGHDSYDAREGRHDDLLFAACLAVWGAEKSLSQFEAW